MAIDFTKFPIPDRKITEIEQEIKVGDKVRCYNNDSDNTGFDNFIGYAYVTAILDKNYCWCEADLHDFENGYAINYAYYVILQKDNNNKDKAENFLV